MHPLTVLPHLWARFSDIHDHYGHARSRRHASARRVEARPNYHAACKAQYSIDYLVPIKSTGLSGRIYMYLGMRGFTVWAAMGERVSWQAAKLEMGAARTLLSFNHSIGRTHS